MNVNIRNFFMVSGHHLIADIQPIEGTSEIVKLVDPIRVFQLDTPSGEMTTAKAFLPATSEREILVRSESIISSSTVDPFFLVFYARSLMSLQRDRIRRELSMESFSEEKKNAILKFKLEAYIDELTAKLGLPSETKQEERTLH